MTEGTAFKEKLRGGPAGGGTELRILELEDVSDDAELIDRELRKEGIFFVSRRVQTHESFMLAIEEFVPDLILADCKLPAFDGLSALSIAKERCPDIPFIFVGTER